jgi:DNA-binding NarL/FixJ family response regulator
MTRVFLADPRIEERSALRVLIVDLQMEMVGEASDWFTLYSKAGAACPDMILLSWELLPKKRNQAIDRLRRSCPDAHIVAIVNQVRNFQDVIQLTSVDAFISKEDFPLKVAEVLSKSAGKRDLAHR